MFHEKTGNITNDLILVPPGYTLSIWEGSCGIFALRCFLHLLASQHVLVYLPQVTQFLISLLLTFSLCSVLCLHPSYLTPVLYV